MSRRKAITEDVATSHTSPTFGNTSIPLQHGQVFITDDSLLTVKKIELSNFDDNDPVGWIALAEQYFTFHQTFENLKVQLAFICMEGAALHLMLVMPTTCRPFMESICSETLTSL